MKISELIYKLAEIQKQHGDLDVIIPQIARSKWIAGITLVEVGNSDWDDFGDSKNKVVIA